MNDIKNYVTGITGKFGNDTTRLMDILLELQRNYRHIPAEAIDAIAENLHISKVDVEQTASFYHFFTTRPTGKYTVYLNNSVVACMKGRNATAAAFEREVGCKFGEVSSDGLIGLFNTACIGMDDQEPAAIINDVVFTNLTHDKVKGLVTAFREGKAVNDLVTIYGDGVNGSILKTMVNNNIRYKGPVLFSPYTSGSALKKIIEMTPDQVITEVKNSNIRGRGGAGFPTGLKWEFCSKSEDKERYVVCNADEGEPGTFKDRVLLTEFPGLIFEGMIIAGYAIGAKLGVLYLRNEYIYLLDYLQKFLGRMKDQNFLGNDIMGKKGFDFDIRIQLGAGAYVCGEETALIESAEGKRGEPRNRPPYPIQVGYLQKPTVVNNVETLCSITHIIEKGAEWYTKFGTKYSTGTKLLSVSGDCKFPGIYEIEWGTPVSKVILWCGAENVQAVQVAGPSGVCIPPSQFERKLDFDDLPTGGSIIIIGQQRNLLKDVVMNFMEFFTDESCGSCVPCRALTPVLKNKLQKILDGKGVKEDITEMQRLGKMMKDLNRCGLGQTAANPILSTIENFKDKYETLVKEQSPDGVYAFDMEAAVKDSCAYAGRKSVLN